MALDTAMKRFSMLNMASSVYPLLFEPDGSVDADDRAFLLRVYGGNALSSAVVSAIQTFAITGRFDTGATDLLLGLEGGYRLELEDGFDVVLDETNPGSLTRGISGRFDTDTPITGRID